MPRIASCSCGTCPKCKARAYTAASRARAAAAPPCTAHPDRPAVHGRKCSECRREQLGRVPRAPKVARPCTDCGTVTLELKRDCYRAA